jgi:capsular polysaccharide biosynthesis protein
MVDTREYLRTNLDILRAGVPPFFHICLHGAAEGRQFLVGPTRRLLAMAVQRCPRPVTIHQLACSGALQTLSVPLDMAVVARPTSALERVEVIDPPPAPLQVFGPPKYQNRQLPAQSVPVLAGGYGLAYQRNIIAFGGSRILFDANTGTAYSDELSAETARLYHPRGGICSGLGPGHTRLQLRQVAGRHPSGILLCSEYDWNYFHFTAEVLPRLRTVEKATIPTEVPIFVTAGLHENLRLGLTRMVGDTRRIETLTLGLPYFFEELYLPIDPVSVHDNYWSPVRPGKDSYMDPGGLLYVRQKLLRTRRGTSARSRFGKRIYLARTSSAIRKPGNLKAVEVLLKDHGFSVVDTGSLTLDEQIEAFSGADTIIGPTGAAMTNLLFCQPGTSVLVFFGEHIAMNHYYFSHLAETAGAHLRVLVCPMVPVSQRRLPAVFAMHEDYEVPLPDLQAFLSEL